MDPAASNAQLAPYYPLPTANLLADGCVTAMLMTDLTVISTAVVAALRKPDSMETTINITIEVEGTDVAQPASWRVLNASLVLARSPLLRLPAEAGHTDAESIRMATKGIGGIWMEDHDCDHIRLTCEEVDIFGSDGRSQLRAAPMVNASSRAAYASSAARLPFSLEDG